MQCNVSRTKLTDLLCPLTALPTLCICTHECHTFRPMLKTSHVPEMLLLRTNPLCLF